MSYDWKKLLVKMKTANGFEPIELGLIENAEIKNQAKRIFGPPEELRWESEHCKVLPDDVVIEIGACIGLFSIRAGLQGARRLITFEPNLDNFWCTGENSLLGFAGRESSVKVINAAVCDHDGTVPFYNVPAVGQHGLFLYNRKGDATEVKSVTLDSLWRKKSVSKVGFLKCDGNGSEHLIFAGLSDENLVKIRCLSVQYHHQLTELVPGWKDSFLNRLTKLGYQIETGPINSWKDDWIKAWRS